MKQCQIKKFLLFSICIAFLILAYTQAAAETRFGQPTPEKKLPVEINPEMEYQWFHYRLADLQEPPWQLVYIRQDVYEVEPTLRKLLNMPELAAVAAS